MRSANSKARGNNVKKRLILWLVTLAFSSASPFAFADTDTGVKPVTKFWACSAPCFAIDDKVDKAAYLGPTESKSERDMLEAFEDIQDQCLIAVEQEYPSWTPALLDEIETDHSTASGSSSQSAGAKDYAAGIKRGIFGRVKSVSAAGYGVSVSSSSSYRHEESSLKLGFATMSSACREIEHNPNGRRRYRGRATPMG